jgi:hypothetical protein
VIFVLEREFAQKATLDSGGEKEEKKKKKRERIFCFKFSFGGGEKNICQMNFD